MTYSDYYEAYMSRVNFYGTTMPEKYFNLGIREFEKKLADSPHRLLLSSNRKPSFSCIIVSNKEDESKKTMILYARYNEDIAVGDLINWDEEKWIVYRKQKKVNETYQTFYIIRCNYLVKWVTKDGKIDSSYCYFVSSMDSKIKENFRSWHNLNSPQPNKYAEMIMPKKEITRHTNFIVEDEGWNVTETDFSSVPGIIYVSLCEAKVNQIYDDLNEDIADTDKITKYSLSFPENGISATIGEKISPNITILKNGIVDDGASITVLPYDLEYIDQNLVPIKDGQTYVIVRYGDNHEELVEVNISENPQENIYIKGNDNIKLDRISNYQLIGIEDNSSISFTVDKEEYASVITSSEFSCTLKANDDNRLGTITLSAFKDGNICASKIINIIPLW